MKSPQADGGLEAFVAFEGGGAKGLLHVGALRTLEARNVTYRGLAGTSAGAIVAAFAAAGLKADDLFSAERGTTLMDRLRQIDGALRTPTDLFGVGGWGRVTRLRGVLRRPRLLRAGLAIFFVAFAALFFAAGRGWWITAGVAAVLVALVLGAAAVVLHRASRGLNRLDQLRGAAAQLLQQTMFPNEPNRTVVMRDFGGEGGRPSLKIVSANLETRSLHLFSPEETPDVPVADAIAASICLPVVFEPWHVGGDRHVDGGIVSNLPAWPFDEERELFPDAITLAVKIGEPPARHRGWWLHAFALTALFGTSRLSTRIFGQGVRIDMPTTLGTLDFDLPWDRACQEVADAERYTRAQLDRQLFELPTLFREACRVIKDLASDVIEEALEVRAERVRVAVAVPDERYFRSLRLRYSAGFDEDQDAELLLPREGTILGAAVAVGSLKIDLRPFDPAHCLLGPHNTRRRRLVWRARNWIVAIPIYREDATHGTELALVVQIDGNTALPDDAGAIQLALEQVADAANAFFTQVVAQLRDEADRHGQTTDTSRPEQGGAGVG